MLRSSFTALEFPTHSHSELRPRHEQLQTPKTGEAKDQKSLILPEAIFTVRNHKHFTASNRFHCTILFIQLVTGLGFFQI